MTEQVIRPANRGDVGGITACVDRSYGKYVPLMGQKPGPMTEDYDRVVAEREVHVAISNGGVVGVLVLIPGSNCLLLDNVAVDPVTQGKGLGKKLVSIAERRARELGLPAVELYTHICMTENQSLYAALGYQETERVTEKGFDRIYYRKALG